jgi:hypothetical protein
MKKKYGSLTIRDKTDADTGNGKINLTKDDIASIVVGFYRENDDGVINIRFLIKARKSDNVVTQVIQVTSFIDGYERCSEMKSTKTTTMNEAVKIFKNIFEEIKKKDDSICHIEVHNISELEKEVTKEKETLETMYR